MRKLKFCFTFILSFFILHKAFSQTQGCLIGGVLYNRATYAIVPDLGCGWQTPGSPRVGWSGIEILACTLSSGSSGGFIAKPVTSCALDANIFLLILPLGLLGLYYTKKQRFQA